ncbi:Hexokinase type 2 [Frankliniella fusca]|uniref:Hexokinase type 2 n=1 Tax=Frankliniella fusca TaxID=407009 RepID=A0AAE1HJB9_9NEOP|nr:Hexokinase type 2 [Frankliniella fusca]
MSWPDRPSRPDLTSRLGFGLDRSRRSHRLLTHRLLQPTVCYTFGGYTVIAASSETRQRTSARKMNISAPFSGFLSDHSLMDALTQGNVCRSHAR